MRTSPSAITAVRASNSVIAPPTIAASKLRSDELSARDAS